MLTPLKLFQSRWREGCGSTLCQGVSKCLLRGTVPCHVLFVGEAPSFPADVFGIPFVGVSGILLDDIIEQSVPESVTSAFTNLVGCIPLESESRNKIVQPPPEAIRACQPRLREFIALCNPKVIIAVGRIAEHWLSDMRAQHMFSSAIPVVYVVHPASILRTKYNGYLVRQAVETLRKAVAEHIGV